MPRDPPAIGTKAKRWLGDMLPKHGRDLNSNANVDTCHTICCTALNRWYISTYKTWFKINSLCNYLRPGWRVHESCQYFTGAKCKKKPYHFYLCAVKSGWSPRPWLCSDSGHPQYDFPHWFTLHMPTTFQWLLLKSRINTEHHNSYYSVISMSKSLSEQRFPSSSASGTSFSLL